ncbi:hypothetical protein [Streptomyces sp. NPDC059071]|uniref:hypothetical protein n=1 Tax=unclassified Streptomyces TaxID=2593676 RepID=UPI003625A31F
MAEQQDGEREPQPIDEEAAWAAIVAGYGEEPADPPGARPFRPVEDLALPEPPEEDGGEGEETAPAAGSGPSGAAGTPGAAGASGADGTPGAAGTSGADRTSGAAGASGADGTSGATGTSGGSAGLEKPDKFRKPEAPGAAEGHDGAAGTDGAGKPDEPGKPALGSSVVFAPGVGLGGGPRDYSLAEPDDSDGAAGASDEGHFVPPEPPPLPEADTTTKFAWLAVVGGPVLMLLAVLFQWDMTWWLTTVCVGGFLGGFVTLVARMKHDDEDDDGFDDPGRGAVV